ncbi:hypothetical protein L2E82_06737 [Cichorium intybus]|uniref:Uncharacterized protein n=1 Tax=Cichorium intybus TaxID=13427 RepID=A0ACB9HBG4_CICIN|nr:hypothetical protein L2E82_06737 [Cichorium intybus]
MKVFSLALLIYLDYKALKHREKWINSSERAALWEKTHERNAKRIVNLIIEIEGLWVKMGQYFSVRADGLPGAYPRHLKQLQDSLPPRCLKEVHKTIKTEMGKSIDDLFANFVEKPLATASDLKNAKSVVDGIVWAEPKFNFNHVIDEWCKEAPKELDFNREAENTRKVSSNLGCKKELLNIRPEHRVKVLMPEVIHSSPHHPILLDFGFTKMLSSSMKHAVAKMFLASAENDIIENLNYFTWFHFSGLSSALNVSVSYYRIIRPFAESALGCDPNELTVDKAEWICDSPVNSQLEKKLRALLVRLGNVDKILGIQVCAYKDGEVIIDTAAGVLGNYDPSPVKPDTLFPGFSVTKGVTAGMLHWLVDKGKLKLEDNVADIWPDIWPDFSSNRKESIKVHHVLNHTSGLQNALASLVQDNPMVLCNWDECLKRIAMAEAESEPGKDQQYHYLSYGWLCGGIIEHASNKRFQDILLEAFIQPLKIEGELYIGIPPEIDSPTSISSPTSLSSSSSSSIFQLDVLSGLVPLFNTLNVRRAILPAANGHCSARALARYYAALVDGGVVPPPHSSSSQPPLGSHPHLPGSISVAIADKKKGGKNKKQKKEKRCSGSSCAINPVNPSCSDDVDFFQACKIFSNQKAEIHDSILGIGEYEKLVFPMGNLGLDLIKERKEGKGIK